MLAPPPAGGCAISQRSARPAGGASPDGAPAASDAGCATCADRVCAANPDCCADRSSHACVLEAAIGCDETCEVTGQPIVDPALRADARLHGPAPASTSHTVTPVLFVSADLAGDPLVELSGRLFAELAREGQGLYWHATGGQTFALEPLEIVIGAHHNDDYPDSGPVRAEVTSAIGRANDGAHDTWILWIGGSGQGAPTATPSGIQPSPRADCEEKTWIITAGMGAIVHELGHTFGLGHEDDHEGEVPPASFMSAHWSYFDIRSPEGAAGALSEVYKERLRASPFFAGGR